MKRIAICDDSEIERQIFSEMLKEYWRMLHRQVEIVEIQQWRSTDCGRGGR